MSHGKKSRNRHLRDAEEQQQKGISLLFFYASFLTASLNNKLQLTFGWLGTASIRKRQRVLTSVLRDFRVIVYLAEDPWNIFRYVCIHPRQFWLSTHYAPTHDA